MFLCFRSEVDVDGVVVSLAHCSQTGTVALQLEDGQIKKLIWGQSPQSCSSAEIPVLLNDVLCKCIHIKMRYLIIKQHIAQHGICREALASSLPNRRCLISSEQHDNVLPGTLTLTIICMKVLKSDKLGLKA